MKYRLSIGNYGKMIKILRDTAIFGLCGISFFIFLLEYKYIEFESTIGIILFLFSIFGAPIFSIIRLRKNHTKEDIFLDNDGIRSTKYGIIKFKDIRSYKLQRFGAFETLIIRMYDNTKYGIAGIFSSKAETYNQYFKFRDEFLQILTYVTGKQNQGKKEEIKEVKSYLQYLYYICLGIVILMTIIFLIHRTTNANNV
jgi:hypothetical protein